jgi:DtxR family Mn-dependent transcriptional regulator
MSRTTELSEAVEDYLKVIYQLTDGGEAATTAAIARHMGVRDASVTGMIQRLAGMHPPLVEYRKHHGAHLTEAGRQKALRVIRRHRLIEQFLVEKLSYAWDEVHGEAEELEHAASEQFVDRLAEWLGDPAFDPHGEPIPDHQLRMPEAHNVPLSTVLSGEQVLVRQIDAEEPELLSYLGDLGVYPGVELEVLRQIPIDHTMQVKLTATQREIVFGSEISEKIGVEKPESNAGRETKTKLHRSE